LVQKLVFGSIRALQRGQVVFMNEFSFMRQGSRSHSIAIR
jgi:hypothetical protein